MPEAIFDLQVVTPLFLAGANQQEYELERNNKKPEQPIRALGIAPEFRPPSFRGLMRYWLRTAVAGLANAQPIELEDVDNPGPVWRRSIPSTLTVNPLTL